MKREICISIDNIIHDAYLIQYNRFSIIIEVNLNNLEDIETINFINGLIYDNNGMFIPKYISSKNYKFVTEKSYGILYSCYPRIIKSGQNVTYIELQSDYLEEFLW